VGRDSLDQEQSRAAGAAEAPRLTQNSEPLSWPLVERRRHPVIAPVTDRRRSTDPVTTNVVTTIEATPLAPFRIAALIGAIIRAVDTYRWSDWTSTICTAIVTVFTFLSIWRPVPYSNDSRSRLRTVVEMALITGVVIVSGGWQSPFTLCLVPTAMLASFVSGTFFSAELVAGSAALISIDYLHEVGADEGLPNTALWIGLLALVTVTSGLSFRAAQQSAQQQQAALDRMGRLAEANALLFSLQRVAQTLPASLDLDEVLDSTVTRVQSLIDHGMLTILLQTDVPDILGAVRAIGYPAAGTVCIADLPTVMHDALKAPKTVRLEDTSTSRGLAPAARSGLYASLRARGSVIGLIAVEALEPNQFGQQQAEILHGLTEPFGIAIDNARLFQRLRIVSADEERNRIARDLHDHIGSSLAYLGFEIDRSIAAAERGEPIDTTLKDLRAQVTSMVGEVRETLYDLRSDVSETQDLATTLKQFVDRVRGRSGLEIAFSSDQRVRLSLSQERELWHIAREALINVERHAQATQASLEWICTPSHAVLTIRDNGVGLVLNAGRVDSYGMRGMRERAATIGAQMTTDSSPTGTVIRVGLHQPKGVREWV
jgi:signal transduction histidine kinase